MLYRNGWVDTAGVNLDVPVFYWLISLLLLKEQICFSSAMRSKEC